MFRSNDHYQGARCLYFAKVLFNVKLNVSFNILLERFDCAFSWIYKRLDLTFYIYDSHNKQLLYV
jgi:hypothetical protein